MAYQPDQDPYRFSDKYTYGSNRSGAKEIFKERVRYDTKFDLFYGDRKTFSTWTKDRFYGIVNTKGNTVIPDQRRLKSLRFSGDSGRQLFALDFVADAWNDLSLRLIELSNKNLIFKNSPWANPTVFRAWQPSQDAYDIYLREEIYPIFANEYMQTYGNDLQVKDFHTFLAKFDDFAKNVVSKAGPLTRSGMIEGYSSPNYMSGLIIEISDDDYDDDYNKTSKFLDDNFDLISAVVTQYGFSIDKNIPWRLVADVSNPAMQEYMAGVPIVGFDIEQSYDYVCKPAQLGNEVPPIAFGYSQIPGLENVKRHIAFYKIPGGEFVPGYARYKQSRGDSSIADNWTSILDSLSTEEVYSTMFLLDFIETWTSDIDTLQQYLVYFYNFYVSARPSVLAQRPSTQTCPPLNYSVERRPISLDDFNRMYGNPWKLKTFYVLRNIERDNNLSVAAMSKAVQDFYNIYNLSAPENDTEAYRRALTYIQGEYIGPADTDPLTMEYVYDIILSK
jgi:hypothetical protein